MFPRGCFGADCFGIQLGQHLPFRQSNAITCLSCDLCDLDGSTGLALPKLQRLQDDVSGALATAGADGCYSNSTK